MGTSVSPRLSPARVATTSRARRRPTTPARAYRPEVGNEPSPLVGNGTSRTAAEPIGEPPFAALGLTQIAADLPAEADQIRYGWAW
jgi:hypothetical protein